MGFDNPFENLKGIRFFSSAGSVSHTFSPINLTVSIPTEVVFAFGMVVVVYQNTFGCKAFLFPPKFAS